MAFPFCERRGSCRLLSARTYPCDAGFNQKGRSNCLLLRRAWRVAAGARGISSAREVAVYKPEAEVNFLTLKER